MSLRLLQSASSRMHQSPSISPDLQVLPFCSEETLERLEQNLSGMPTVSQMLNEGLTVEQITARWVRGGWGAMHTATHATK
jgi:redox-regulated HSP33 family molecular chaperone